MKRNLVLSEASVADALQSFVELGIVRKVRLRSTTPTTEVIGNRPLAEGQLRTLRRPPRRRSGALGEDKQRSVSIHLAESKRIHLPRSDDNLLLKALFEEFCEHKLIQPTFVLHHPRDSTPLCKAKRDEPQNYI